MTYHHRTSVMIYTIDFPIAMCILYITSTIAYHLASPWWTKTQRAFAHENSDEAVFCRNGSCHEIICILLGVLREDDNDNDDEPIALIA
jgi:hypothetical protein